jgi:hypothetical protein
MREAETNAPEETADMTRAQAGDVDLTESGLIEIDRSCIIAELLAHEPCKVDMTILVFIGNKSDQETKKTKRGRRGGDQQNGEVRGRNV